MWLGQNEPLQGFGCPGGACIGADGQVYNWVQGVDGLGNPVGYWGAAGVAGPALGEIAQGPDGGLYQWVEGIDGLGNPVGFWKKLRKGLKSLVKRALPIAKFIAPFVPGGAAALTVATPFLKQAGLTGWNGLGALYQAPDGNVYQMQGYDSADDLTGVEADDELRGLSQDELRGLYADDELSADAELSDEGDIRGVEDDGDIRGFEDDGDIRGFEDDDIRGIEDVGPVEGFSAEEMSGFADDEMRGIEADEMQGVEGYVRQNGMNGIEAYLPDLPRQTPWFRAPAQAPPLWSPLW
jgi:hypothetical protein